MASLGANAEALVARMVLVCWWQPSGMICWSYLRAFLYSIMPREGMISTERVIKCNLMNEQSVIDIGNTPTTSRQACKQWLFFSEYWRKNSRSATEICRNSRWLPGRNAMRNFVRGL